MGIHNPWGKPRPPVAATTAPFPPSPPSAFSIPVVNSASADQEVLDRHWSAAEQVTLVENAMKVYGAPEIAPLGDADSLLLLRYTKDTTAARAYWERAFRGDP